jgi:hypothetical protein
VGEMKNDGKTLDDVIKNVDRYCERCRRECKNDFSVITVFVNEYCGTKLDFCCARANLNDFSRRKKK